MTGTKQREWHEVDRSGLGEMTVRQLGPHFQAIRAWADRNDVSDIFDAIAVVFGFTENFTVVADLCRVLAGQDAQEVLSHWADNPYITQLSRLLSAFNQDSTFAKSYPGFPHDFSKKDKKKILSKAGADLENRHFLLELILHPQPPSDKQVLDKARTSLVLWLIVQALERVVEKDCPHDAQVQHVASVLCVPRDSRKWRLIERVLEWTLQSYPSANYTYRQFDLAIRYAAAQLLPRFLRKKTQIEKDALTAILLVSEGQINPTDAQITAYSFQPCFDNLRSVARSTIDLESQSGDPQLITCDGVDIESADEDSLDQLFLLGVDPTLTPEQQKLSGRSILMQTAELSNYLPWSWDKPLPPETQALEIWLAHTLADQPLAEKLGAALVWLAVHLQRSLEFVQEIEISDATQEEWSISRDLLNAHRDRPKRHSAWYPGAGDAALVEPFEDILSITLPEQIQSTLREAVLLYPVSPTLRDLWSHASPSPLTVWFGQHSKKHFPRLTSVKLANGQSQRVFDETGDHSLARMLSAHPRSALPAACGYANWDIKQVQNGFSLPVPESALKGERTNVLGSFLAPLESVLVDVIRVATDKLLAGTNGDVISFHNALAQYTATALNAATGCRYLSEPFESLAHFCDQPSCVFINDKSDDGLHSGRMVPLAQGALKLLKNFVEHLRRFKNALADGHPDLSHRIQTVLDGRSESLPLFFLLDTHGAWHPLNDLGVPGADLFAWPLPKNLFRHRFSQQLARLGVDPEVIDGWMGHGERGTTSYSDHSARCWRDDYERYKADLDECFDRLGFHLSLPEAHYDRATFTARPSTDDYREPERFGQARRHAERLKVRNVARAEARRELDLMPQAKLVLQEESIEPSAINELVNRMILRENGLPHPQATVRMEVLVQWLEDCSPKARQYIRHRVAKMAPERALVRETCPGAMQAMPQLRQWVLDTKQSILQARYSKSDGLAVAAAFVAIEKRISYLGLLADLVQGQNYRVIQHKQHVYLEYAESMEPDDYEQPVQRHQVDHATGRLLARGLGIKVSKDLDTTHCPKPLQPLVDILVATGHLDNDEKGRLSLARLLIVLSRLIEQANLIDLPGIVAGALSERNPPTSLCVYDYYRLTEGKRYETPESVAESGLTETDRLPAIPVSVAGAYPESFYDTAKAFFRALQNILHQYTKRKSREIAEQVEKQCRANAHEVSSAVLLVGYWVAYRIRRGKGRAGRGHKPYAAASIKRYLTALSAAFRGFASRTHLLLMSEEEVTELCALMLSYNAHNIKNLEYFSARLIDFFDWASEQGVSSPDWDELDLGGARRSVRPRLFSEDEYLQALQLLLRADADDVDRGMQAAFVLFLAFRFGLRAKEALGLLRSDWCGSAGLIWVLVQSNAIRSLKSTAHSRRAVPLMFELTDTEQSLIDTLVTRYTTRFGNDGNKPLLSGKDGHLTAFAGSIPSDIARALKVVTGNARMSLHQARHGFCNVLSCALFEIETPLSKKLTESVDKASLRRILLGQHAQPSRRSAMAIARALGHQSPRTQLRSYNRMVTEWADMLTPVISHYANSISNAVQIERWPVKGPAELQDQAQTIFARQSVLTPLNVIKALRLMALGYGVPRIEQLLRLPTGELADLEVLVDRINASLRFKVHDPEQAKKVYVYGAQLPRFLLKSRPSAVWPRLMRLCETLPSCDALGHARPLPTLAQASNLVGRNGHLLMRESEDSNLIRLLVDALSIPEHAYTIGIAGKPEYLTQVLDAIHSVGFVHDPTQKLDTFNADYDTGYTRARAYAGLVLTTPVVDQIHDRLDLVILFIAIALACCPKPEPLSAF